VPCIEKILISGDPSLQRYNTRKVDDGGGESTVHGDLFCAKGELKLVYYSVLEKTEACLGEAEAAEAHTSARPRPFQIYRDPCLGEAEAFSDLPRPVPRRGMPRASEDPGNFLCDAMISASSDTRSFPVTVLITLPLSFSA